ncbi:MAG: hypothetical protein K2X77_30580 [Candidatus Obscuribacterales bacterium]|jgi:hypothetical protein|nr:hypothetical protein [Candidatus Obscuribacterales bacterium]
MANNFQATENFDSTEQAQLKDNVYAGVSQEAWQANAKFERAQSNTNVDALLGSKFELVDSVAQNTGGDKTWATGVSESITLNCRTVDQAAAQIRKMMGTCVVEDSTPQGKMEELQRAMKSEGSNFSLSQSKDGTWILTDGQTTNKVLQTTRTQSGQG